ncbi:AMP-binding protein [Actinomadura madurae]|nr:AMP-binding protein [Actinomadura madurae]
MSTSTSTNPPPPSASTGGSWPSPTGSPRSRRAERAGRVPLLDDDEHRRLLVDWNDTATEVPETDLSDMFAERVARAPDAVAVVSDEVRLTYAELDERANRLAHHLTSLGIGPESVVAVAMSRGVDLIVALVAVWKAGAAYLPIDTAYPADRIRFMLADSHAAVLLGQEELLDELPVRNILAVAVDSPGARGAGRGTRDGPRRGPEAGLPGLRDLHLRLHRQAEGRHAHPCRAA